MIGTKVYVYYNLHKSCWSIKDYKTNKVIAHCQSIHLKDIEFRVRQGGRNRVIKEQSKNVHAFVIGTVISFNKSKRSFKKGAIYNPYSFNSFMDRANLYPLFKANEVFMNKKRKVSYK